MTQDYALGLYRLDRINSAKLSYWSVAMKFTPAAIDVNAHLVRPSGPDHDRCGVRQLARALFALPERPLHAPLLDDICPQRDRNQRTDVVDHREVSRNVRNRAGHCGPMMARAPTRNAVPVEITTPLGPGLTLIFVTVGAESVF